jgi:hypothetical protein
MPTMEDSDGSDTDSELEPDCEIVGLNSVLFTNAVESTSIEVM